MIGTNRGRWLKLIAPVDTASTTVNSDVVNMENVIDIEVEVGFGVITGDTVVVTVEECDDVTPTNSTAIAFRYKKSAAVGTDTDGAWTAVAATGVTIAATDDGKTLSISVDPAALSDGYSFLRVVADPGASASVVLIDIGAWIWERYAQATNLTAVV